MPFHSAFSRLKSIRRGLHATDPILLERTIPKGAIKMKQTLKKVSGPIARTQGTPQGDTASQIAALQADIKAFIAQPKQKLNIPIKTGLGPAGGVAATVGVAAAKFLLRAPGTRQVIQKLGGRATTLSPFRGGPTIAAVGTALGVGVTADALIDFGGQALDKVGSRVAPVGGRQMHPGTGRAMARLPGVGGHLPPGTTVVKTWSTGTAEFARLLDGRIAVQKKDGTIKVYRPQKHIVIPRNPRVGTLIRADKRLERLVKGLRKVVKSGKR